MGSKYFFIILLMIFPLLGASNCSPSNPQVKVWEFRADEEAKPLRGWYRGDEVKTFGETDVRYGVNEADLEYILNKLKQCKDIPMSVDNRVILDILLGKK